LQNICRFQNPPKSPFKKGGLQTFNSSLALPFFKGELEGIFYGFKIFAACKIPLNPPLEKGDSKNLTLL
jgi:hypothetical protein